MASTRFLIGCAWAVHLYTALGAVAGLLALNYIAHGDWRGAFTMMAIAVAIAVHVARLPSVPAGRGPRCDPFAVDDLGRTDVSR